MNPRLCRTEALLGEWGMERLENSHVLLVGLGGVGGHALDALVRSGVKYITVLDFDTVSESDLNRQLLATLHTVGERKTDVAVRHARSISDTVCIKGLFERLTPEGVERLLDTHFPDLVLDAIDDVPTKVALAVETYARAIPLVSCLGMGNRLDPTAITVTDIEKTKGCPLARAIRTRLRKQGLTHLPVVFSTEEPRKPTGDVPVASCAYVPSVAGLVLAGEGIRRLLEMG